MTFKKIIVLLLVFFLFSACGDTWTSVKRGLTGQKVNSTDEFLVKKRDPLILPPEYNTLPEPNSNNKSKKTDSNNINKILKLPDQSTSTSTGSSSVEESIMKNIRK